MTTTLEAAPTLLGDLREVWRAPASRSRRLWIGLGGAAVVAGVVLRFWAPTPLWLDEAISVNIARLPITQIPHALSHDGAPPLYYLLLHFWMLAFGQGDFAVRALSGVISVISLPFFWAAGRRMGGRTTAWVAFFLGLTSPFAINYATTTRMYSMMVLWSVLGFLALLRAFEAPTRRRLVALGAVTAAMLYTHYWALYLVAVTGVWLLWRIFGEARTGQPDRWPVRPAFGAMVIGAVCWLPWSPVFVYQALHTGTPWTSAAGPADLLQVFGDFAGTGPWGLLLTFGLFAFVMIGVFGRPVSPSEGTPRASAIMLELRVQPRSRILAGVTLATLVVAVLLGALAHAAFVARYTAIVLPMFLLLVAIGVSTLRDRRTIASVMAVVCLAGLLTGLGENGQQRTQAGQVAAVLNVQAQPGDLVVYCPDQLAPAVDRLLTVPDVTQLTFPRAIGPQRVDWVNYKKVIASTNVGAFAQEMLNRLTPNHTLWLVWRNGYAGLGGDCGDLYSWLNLLRPGGVTVVKNNGHQFYEYENLVRFPN
ncbi:MAG: glycosyltransferase family 39 protein [Acidimicrobiales bacterium]